MIGQGVWILWGVENCHLPLTKPVAVNTGLALPRSPWLVKFGSDRPLLPWWRKFAIFNTKSAITYLEHEVRPRCLHTVGGFQDRTIKWCQSNFAQTTPVAMITKTYRILTENCYNSACTRDMTPILTQKIGFSWSANLTVQTKFVSHQPLLPR